MDERKKIRIEALLQKTKLPIEKRTALNDIKTLLLTAKNKLQEVLTNHNILLDKLTDALADISDDNEMFYLIDEVTEIISKMDEETIELESAFESITDATSNIESTLN